MARRIGSRARRQRPGRAPLPPLPELLADAMQTLATLPGVRDALTDVLRAGLARHDHPNDVMRASEFQSALFRLRSEAKSACKCGRAGCPSSNGGALAECLALTFVDAPRGSLQLISDVWQSVISPAN